MNTPPYKQVHLDFHTSPDIENIGSHFSKENFQAALKLAHADSITVFAKCHHGVCYYPTEVGVMHPKLSFDLTGAMVEAAHEIGVRAPVYITAGWSHYDAEKHPEWIIVNQDGSKRSSVPFDENADSSTPKPHCHWMTLCLSDGNEYTKHIYELTEEVCRRYKNLDGLFYDICTIGEACYCDYCKKSMAEMGLDPNKEEDARKHLILKRQRFMERCGQILHRYHPEATIFFNGTAHQYKTHYLDFQSHYEMENLPTAWGGYNSLPMRAKSLMRKGKGIVGMTGKFHLDWGEFGGFKSPEALKYEVATMATYGVGASVGDHMHPDGEMELQTYKNIGYAYRYLEAIAPFCYGGCSTANLGVYTSTDPQANSGISNILLENQLDYELADQDNFSRFDTVIIPGPAVMDPRTLEALDAYLKNGGKLVLAADALVENGQFQLDLGLRYLGKSQFDCDYLIPLRESEQLPNAPMLCNFPGHRVEAEGAQLLAQGLPPYFSRTYGQFCGHKNTPHNKNAQPYPGVLKIGNVVYLAHPLPAIYSAYGSLYHKRYFMMALEQVYAGSPVQVTGLGSQGRCTMIHQPDKHRYCVNLTYAIPTKRGKAQIIEDIMPLYNIHAEIKTTEPIKSVYLGLTGEKLPFSTENGRTHFTIPKLQCHTSVIAEYA